MKSGSVTTAKREVSKILATLHSAKNQGPIHEGLARGEKAILDGHVCSHKQAKEKLKKWLHK